MKQDVKNYIQGLMVTGGHRHESMTDTLRCVYCGNNFKKAERQYHWLRKEKPELFIKKEPEYKESEETAQMRQMLIDRLNRDKLYQEHIRLSEKGTLEEKIRENKRANRGYYRRHSNYEGIKTFL